jgi:cell division protein FtsB
MFGTPFSKEQLESFPEEIRNAIRDLHKECEELKAERNSLRVTLHREIRDQFDKVLLEKATVLREAGRLIEQLKLRNKALEEAIQMMRNGDPLP